MAKERQNRNPKIKISKQDMSKFPVNEMKIDSIYEDVYNPVVKSNKK